MLGIGEGVTRSLSSASGCRCVVLHFSVVCVLSRSQFSCTLVALRVELALHVLWTHGEANQCIPAWEERGGGGICGQRVDEN